MESGLFFAAQLLKMRGAGRAGSTGWGQLQAGAGITPRKANRFSAAISILRVTARSTLMSQESTHFGFSDNPSSRAYSTSDCHPPCAMVCNTDLSN